MNNPRKPKNQQPKMRPMPLTREIRFSPCRYDEPSPPQQAHWPEGAIFTLGHSTLPIERFIELLETYGIQCAALPEEQASDKEECHHPKRALYRLPEAGEDGVHERHENGRKGGPDA